MKKTARGCFAVTAVFAMIVAVLASMGRLQIENVRERPPLTRQELDTLAQEWLKTAPSAELPGAGPTEINQTPAAALKAQADLPHRLNRCATENERREFFISGMNAGDKLFAMAACSPLGDAAYALFAVAEPVNIYWERAEVNVRRYNWDVARNCLSEYLRQSDSGPMAQHVCGRLAWLEDDPELAARYMELASAGGRLGPLYDCSELAEKTGSTELARHYRALKDAALAEYAEQVKQP